MSPRPAAPTDRPTPVEPDRISDTWVATDALGRTLPTHAEVGDRRANRTVGLFYWTWHDEGDHAPVTPESVLKDHPEAIHDFAHPAWPKDAGPYHWAEPRFGFYRRKDPWVLRKHAEMLADAGVDVVFFDCTNGNYTWKPVYTRLLACWAEARRDGVRAPQIAFMLPFWPDKGSLEILEELYRDLYRPGLHRDQWFHWKGKPFIMAYPDNLTDVPGDAELSQMHAEIRDFFTFRPGRPQYNLGPDPARGDQWGWLEIFPQHGYIPIPGDEGRYEQMTVGVAQNWSAERGLTAMNAPLSFDRNYTHAHGPDARPDAYLHGLNFQEQWERALAVDPEFIFITGWNEWLAGRFETWGGITNAFPDEFSPLCSRDIEPMKGGFGDNYYYQMVNNIRRYKGVRAQVPATPMLPLPLTMDGDFTAWQAIQPEYRHHRGSTLHRDFPGWKGHHYVNTSGRNNIVLAKVCHDAEHLYFYAQTAAPLSPASDPHWMMLFIDIDRSKNTGWEGYDFVVNRRAPGADTAVLETTARGWHWRTVGVVTFIAHGAELMLRIPKRLLGLGAAIDIEFKWSDNLQVPGDIEDFLVNGDVAPSGRFNYRYQSQAGGTTGNTGTAASAGTG